MKSSKKIRKVSLLGLILVGSIAITQVLAHPHHIIISQKEFHTTQGETITIPFEVFFSSEEQATVELYGDKVAGWGCKLQASSDIAKAGESLPCGIVVPVPSNVENGTYGLILQDKDASGTVTSRVSIFIIVGEGGTEVQQEMHYYDGWIAYENFPRDVTLPAHNVDITVGWRCLAPGTYRIVVDHLFSVDFTRDGEHTHFLGLSGWYTGGIRTITIQIGNITNYEPESPWDIGTLIEEKKITINVHCPGSEDAVLLDTLVFNAGVGVHPVSNANDEEEVQAEVAPEEPSDESQAVIEPEPEPQPRTWITIPRAWKRLVKIFPL
ncbi:MAG: hypothetical protein DRO00_08280 [Thermoproteota archaeon]|nr:MAG: hypothetical protein DRO00_08280 [Candidatus Korarchaeota archaeon]